MPKRPTDALHQASTALVNAGSSHEYEIGLCLSAFNQVIKNLHKAGVDDPLSLISAMITTTKDLLEKLPAEQRETLSKMMADTLKGPAADSPKYITH